MSEWGLGIHPVFPLWTILIGFFLCLSFLLWKEIKRKLKFLPLRIVAIFLLLISIVGVLLQPSWESERKSRGLVLLTPNFKSSTVDSLFKTNPQLTLIRTPDVAPFLNAESKSLNDLSTLDIQFVLGDGLPEYVFTETKNDFRFIKGQVPKGIIDWVPPKKYQVNQQAEIKGKFRARENVKIRLTSPGGVEDSVVFTTQGVHDFTLSFTPKQTGLFTYSILVEENNKVYTNKFPVEVAANEKLSILFLQNYPTAETRYLKNFLTEKGHALAIRSQLSKTNFRFEYSNREAVRLDRLSPELLKQFDLVLIDNESLADLPSYEMKMMEESVKQGLGILVFYISPDKRKNLTYLSLPQRESKEDTVRLRVGNSSYTFPVVPVFITADGVESVIKNNERVLSGYVNKGDGKLGFQLLQETYRLMLEGRTFEYASLWSALLERTARIKNATFKIEMAQPFPFYPDEPIDIVIVAAEDQPRLTSNAVEIPLREDVVIDDYWHGKTWASETGWHQFIVPQDSTTTNHYVSNPGEWQSLRISQQHKANELFSKNKLNDINEEQIIRERKPIALWVFYFIFLFAAGFLWLVPKL
jgi:hypothetical protein